MKPKKSGLLKRLQWRLECIAFLVVERLLSLVPFPALWNAGAALSGLSWLLPSRRLIVRNNLRIVLGPAVAGQEVKEVTRNVIRHSGANLLCSFKAAHMPLAALREVVVLEDRKVLDRALAANRGVVIILSHMGNWELLAQLGPIFYPDARISTIYRPLNNPHFDRIIADRRRRRGMTLFAKKDSITGPAAFLRQGGIVNILSDQRAGRAGALCPLYGRLMSVTPLPSILQRRTGCEVIGLSVRTSSPGRWIIKFHPPPPHKPDNFTPAHLTKLLEEMFRESIADVFWFQNLWRFNKRRPLALRAKRGPLRLAAERDRALQPFTLLIRVPDDPEGFAEVLPALRLLTTSRPDLDLHLLARRDLRPHAGGFEAPHQFHAVEDRTLPPHPDLALVLTNDQSAARDLARLFPGPTYSRSGLQPSASPHWRTSGVEGSPAPSDQWISFLRGLGMHDPPLEWEYV